MLNDDVINTAPEPTRSCPPCLMAVRLALVKMTIARGAVTVAMVQTTFFPKPVRAIASGAATVFVEKRTQLKYDLYVRSGVIRFSIVF